jgi:hypothetical protein
MLWPSFRLNDATRYIVGMRSLVSNSGRPILPSSAFAALRDNIHTEDPAVEDRRAHFNTSVFPQLEKAGFARASLQIAWDFTVMSTHTLNNRLLSMRDDALERTAAGISFTISQSEDNPSASIARRVTGRMTVPWYLNQVCTHVHAMSFCFPSPPWPPFLVPCIIHIISHFPALQLARSPQA